ncbi:MAG: hypothetical protein GDA50_08540 [Alphaproteobacteria bacterium GM202ARS2]|nr:hypothetical protein [Alphaproteobacteria bacterium GM202ARS2]
MPTFAFLACITVAHADDGKARAFIHEGLEQVLWVMDRRDAPAMAAPLILALHGYKDLELAEKLHREPKDLG